MSKYLEWAYWYPVKDPEDIATTTINNTEQTETSLLASPQIAEAVTEQDQLNGEQKNEIYSASNFLDDESDKEQTSQVLVDEDDDDDDGIVPPSPRTTLLAHLQARHYPLNVPPEALGNQLESFVRYDVPEGKVDALNAHRMDVLILREHCRQQREMIALHRQDIEILSQNILSHFYEWSSDLSKFNYATAQNLFDSSISQRESLRREELEYQDLEKSLNRKEWELKQQEATIFKHGVPMKTRHLPRNHVSSTSSDNGAMSAIFDIGVDMYEESPFMKSLYEQLAARRSDAEQVEEQILEINAEKEHRLEQKRMLEELQRSAEHDFTEDLAILEVRSRELDGEFQQLQEDIYALEDRFADHLDLSRESQFNDEGALYSLMPIQENMSMESTDDELIGQDVSPSDLPSPEELQEAQSELLEKDMNQSYGIGFSISHWLRYIFVVSRMDLLVYRSCADRYAVDWISSDCQLFRLILRCWPKDAMRKSSRRRSSTENRPVTRGFSYRKGRLASASFTSSKRNSLVSQQTRQVASADLFEVQDGNDHVVSMTRNAMSPNDGCCRAFFNRIQGISDESVLGRKV